MVRLPSDHKHTVTITPPYTPSPLAVTTMIKSFTLMYRYSSDVGTVCVRARACVCVCVCAHVCVVSE